MVSVDRGLVVGIIVDSLHNVDFAGHRPGGTVCPECGPRSAASWHMHGIQDHQTTRKLTSCLYSYTLPATLNIVGCVDSHNEMAFRSEIDQLGGSSSALIEKFHSPMCRIWCGEERPSVQEVCPFMRLG